MPRKRKTVTKENMDDYFDGPKKKRPHDSPYDLKYERHTYRVTGAIHVALRIIAQENGVGLNALVRHVLVTFILAYRAGEVTLSTVEYITREAHLPMDDLPNGG